MVDEAHLVTIAMGPAQRGRGLGELLLVSMIDLACILGASRMTLEVRVSNHVAQSLYRKYGFKNEGVRRRYYSDNGEDALIMTTDVLTSAYYQAHYQELKRALLSKLKVTFNIV
jgi:ribosomal-protein-alanine N-acetyltransferase